MAEISAGIKGVYPKRARPIPTKIRAESGDCRPDRAYLNGRRRCLERSFHTASTLAETNVRSRGVLQKWIYLIAAI